MSNFATSTVQPLFGIFSFLFLAWLASESRWKVRWRPVLLALFGQVVAAALALRVPFVRMVFLWSSRAIDHLKNATYAGTSFVFGYVGGADPPFQVVDASRSFVFGLQALPTVMVVSALAMLLFHWRVLPLVVHGFSWVLRRSLGIGGALGVCAAAKVFLGQTEAPLLIRPYLSKLSRSELFTVMTLGMATTSASVMIIYATILSGVVAHPISHILTASLISVPASVAVSRLMIPHEGAGTDGTLISPYKFSSSMEAVSQGATDGMKLFLNIIAMLIVMLALVALVNSCLSVVPLGDGVLSLQILLGWGLAPVAWLMGIPMHETTAAGHLIGTKLALNEVMAFIGLSKLSAGVLSEHSRLIMTYALCGFANFSSIGIQIGGIGTMVPERRREIISLGFRALFAGTLASCMSGTIVGLLSSLG